MKLPRIFARNHADLIELEHLRAENAALQLENSEALELILQKQARIRELESRLPRVQSKRDDKGRFA